MKVTFKCIYEKNRHLHGTCDSDGFITINLMARANPLFTFLHETIHLEQPDWSEAQVQKETAKRWRKMKTRERFNLGKLLFNRRFHQK